MPPMIDADGVPANANVGLNLSQTDKAERERKWRGSTGFGLEIASRRSEEKFVQMPETAEFAFEKTVAVAGFLCKTGRDQAIERRRFPKFGRGAFRRFSFTISFSRCAAIMPAQLHLSLLLTECSAQCGDGGEAEIAPFESRDSSHKLHYIQKGIFLRNSRKNGSP